MDDRLVVSDPNRTKPPDLDNDRRSDENVSDSQGAVGGEIRTAQVPLLSLDDRNDQRTPSRRSVSNVGNETSSLAQSLYTGTIPKRPSGRKTVADCGHKDSVFLPFSLHSPSN